MPTRFANLFRDAADRTASDVVGICDVDFFQEHFLRGCLKEKTEDSPSVLRTILDYQRRIAALFASWPRYLQDRWEKWNAQESDASGTLIDEYTAAYAETTGSQPPFCHQTIIRCAAINDLNVRRLLARITREDFWQVG